MRKLGVCSTLNEFKHLTIGQMRFFLRKQDEAEARTAKSKELNDKLKAQRKRM